jgi:hypothetical protein
VTAIRTLVRQALPEVREILTEVTKVRIRLQNDGRLKGRLAPHGEVRTDRSEQLPDPSSERPAGGLPPGDFWRAGS